MPSHGRRESRRTVLGGACSPPLLLWSLPLASAVGYSGHRYLFLLHRVENELTRCPPHSPSTFGVQTVAHMVLFVAPLLIDIIHMLTLPIFYQT